MAALQRALDRLARGDPTLTELDLSLLDLFDGGSDAEVQRLATALVGNSTLTYLDLGDNSIGAEGARALAEMLPGNATLTTLYLGWNSIGPEGARALAELLPGNSTLKALDLYGNSIGAEGARALAEMLAGNSTLTTLDLSDNFIGAYPESFSVPASEEAHKGTARRRCQS